MTLNDVALLYAALGISWGGLAAFRMGKEFAQVFGKDGDIAEFAEGNQQLEEIMHATRARLHELPPLFAGFAVALVLAMIFVAGGLTWPIGVFKQLRKVAA